MLSLLKSFIFLSFLFFFLMVVWISWWWRYNFYYNRESSSCFECGFDSKDFSRLPFSLRFFSILILFLMFDVELVLLLQLPLGSMKSSLYFLYYISFFFFLVVGVVEEWRRCVFDWKF